MITTWVQTSRHCRPSTIALQLSRQTRKPRDKASTEQQDTRLTGNKPLNQAGRLMIIGRLNAKYVFFNYFKRVAKQSGLFPRLGEYSNVGRESGKGKTTLLRHLRHSKHGAAGACFSVLAPACTGVRFGLLPSTVLRISLMSHAVFCRTILNHQNTDPSWPRGPTAAPPPQPVRPHTCAGVMMKCQICASGACRAVVHRHKSVKARGGEMHVSGWEIEGLRTC